MSAIRYGLFSKSIVLDNERKKNFKTLTCQYREYFNPQSAVEEGIIEEMEAACWRMRRVWALETRMLNQSMPEPGITPEPTTNDYVDEMQRIVASYSALAATQHFGMLHHHEGRLHRTFQRSLRAILLLKQANLKPPTPQTQNSQNEPNENSGPETSNPSQTNPLPITGHE